MATSDTSDEFGKNHRFAKTSTPEQTGFTTTNKRGEKVDNLDARLENFGVG